MRHLTIVVILLLIAVPLMAGAPQGEKGNANLDKLKSLVGTWKGTEPDGKPVSASYRLVSEDNTLMETLDTGGKKESMISVYHLDNDKVMMTHYCSMGNQPRMRLSRDSKDPNKFIFNFVDATNLKSKDDAHMHKLIVTIKDNNHFSQEWYLRAKGKENPIVMNFERVN